MPTVHVWANITIPINQFKKLSYNDSYWFKVHGVHWLMLIRGFWRSPLMFEGKYEERRREYGADNMKGTRISLFSLDWRQ